MREAIERLLGAAGICCSAFESAEAALQDQAVGTACCVITDLKLPLMSGLELLAALRGLGLSMPLILITAHDSPELRERALGEGAVALLAKPFRGTALIAAVEAAIHG